MILAYLCYIYNLKFPSLVNKMLGCQPNILSIPEMHAQPTTRKRSHNHAKPAIQITALLKSNDAYFRSFFGCSTVHNLIWL
mmetsp:Transcript_65807/g.109360  ORF Transcript_65807/g.109360 Transcript_65807/m.109360 type:complete len:81 (-) Transcript_65807:878-1120(-)